MRKQKTKDSAEIKLKKSLQLFHKTFHILLFRLHDNLKTRAESAYGH